MLFGEIDCREGLLLSVERGRYRDLEEGVAAVVAIYVNVLMDLLVKRACEIFVHPVPPVLPETRPIVLLFNRLLKQQVEAAAARSPRMACSLHWLDCLAALLEPVAMVTLSPVAAAAAAAAKATMAYALKPDLGLDGTHLSPRYVTALDAALRAI